MEYHSEITPDLNLYNTVCDDSDVSNWVKWIYLSVQITQEEKLKIKHELIDEYLNNESLKEKLKGKYIALVNKHEDYKSKTLKYYGVVSSIFEIEGCDVEKGDTKKILPINDVVVMNWEKLK